LKNKQLYNETKDKYYDDLQSSGKIFINSMYGFLGAPGLSFNYLKGASDVTKYGREILTMAVKWATGLKNEEIINLFNN
jgi:DNA polymerase elongation subunit (family B)